MINLWAHKIPRPDCPLRGTYAHGYKKPVKGCILVAFVTNRAVTELGYGEVIFMRDSGLIGGSECGWKKKKITTPAPQVEPRVRKGSMLDIAFTTVSL